MLDKIGFKYPPKNYNIMLSTNNVWLMINYMSFLWTRDKTVII